MICKDLSTLFKGKNSESIGKFRNMILLKDTVSQCLWWLLCGLVIIMYQGSYITNINCVRKVDHSDDKTDAGASKDSDQTKKTPTVYNVS